MSRSCSASGAKQYTRPTAIDTKKNATGHCRIFHDHSNTAPAPNDDARCSAMVGPATTKVNEVMDQQRERNGEANSCQSVPSTTVDFPQCRKPG